MAPVRLTLSRSAAGRSPVRCNAWFGGDVTSHRRSPCDSEEMEATLPASDEPSYFRPRRDFRARARSRAGRRAPYPVAGVRPTDARTAPSGSPRRTPRRDRRGQRAAREAGSVPPERHREPPPHGRLARASSLARTDRSLLDGTSESRIERAAKPPAPRLRTWV